MHVDNVLVAGWSPFRELRAKSDPLMHSARHSEWAQTYRARSCIV